MPRRPPRRSSKAPLVFVLAILLAAVAGVAALDALREDASTGVATAQNELGVRYLVGRGVAQDYGEAAFWLRKAAAQDMTNAQYNLGVLYESGRGV
ncbi:unnamed protein product, partial [Laminaria digitata]